MRSALVLVAAAALGACGGESGDDDGGYPHEAVDSFVAECRTEPQATPRDCRCVIERLQETMPYDEFAAADEALREDREASATSLRKLEQAVRACGAA